MTQITLSLDIADDNPQAELMIARARIHLGRLTGDADQMGISWQMEIDGTPVTERSELPRSLAHP